MASPVKSPQEEIRKLTNRMNILTETIERIEDKIDKLSSPKMEPMPIPKVVVPEIPAPEIVMPEIPSLETMGISNIQKAALQSVLNILGIEYKTLFKAAFKAKGLTLPKKIPNIDNLSCDKAALIVKYGNDNFRKR